MIAYIALGMSTVTLAGLVYILFFALPKIGDGMKELGVGLDALGNRVQEFAAFIAGKL